MSSFLLGEHIAYRRADGHTHGKAGLDQQHLIEENIGNETGHQAEQDADGEVLGKGLVHDLQ